LQAEDGDTATPHQWEAAARRHSRWSWLEVPWLAGSSACWSRGSRGCGLGQEVYVLEMRSLRWCLVAIDKRREGRPVLGVVWRRSGRKPNTDLVSAGGGGTPVSFFFLDTLAMELRLHPR
jgi:hypothetical protein